ncbi:hypothetical protein FGW37_01525 [Streptomyces rectiverticillatus]|uniref:hypothetical protein n=1 Tax=Streptomyces rectiverticillatus TaxID=173860 RepID=UPI0015C40255|nr:hypothetical protein [Streptomyces rectiverticillatus]QLE70462.1 hypothetical protein FGW37_01525 [Streptomyces rectiverticillatus]
MKKNTLRTTVVTLGAGATLLSIASLASAAVASDPSPAKAPSVQMAEGQECTPLDKLPGGVCDPTKEIDPSVPEPSRNPSDRNVKTDIVEADWTRR